MLDVAGIERPGLSRTSFTVPDGGIATIMGPSGSGKSLLLRAIADMDPNVAVPPSTVSYAVPYRRTNGGAWSPIFPLRAVGGAMWSPPYA